MGAEEVLRELRTRELVEEQLRVVEVLAELAHDLLGHTLAIHFRRVDEAVTHVDGGANCCDFSLAAPGDFAHAPRAEAERRDGRAARKIERAHHDSL